MGSWFTIMIMKNSKFANTYLSSIVHFLTFSHVCVRSREHIGGVANDYDPYSMSISDVGGVVSER